MNGNKNNNKTLNTNSVSKITVDLQKEWAIKKNIRDNYIELVRDAHKKSLDLIRMMNPTFEIEAGYIDFSKLILTMSKKKEIEKEVVEEEEEVNKPIVEDEVIIKSTPDVKKKEIIQPSQSTKKRPLEDKIESPSEKYRKMTLQNEKKSKINSDIEAAERIKMDRQIALERIKMNKQIALEKKAKLEKERLELAKTKPKLIKKVIDTDLDDNFWDSVMLEEVAEVDKPKQVDEATTTLEQKEVVKELDDVVEELPQEKVVDDKKITKKSPKEKEVATKVVKEKEIKEVPLKEKLSQDKKVKDKISQERKVKDKVSQDKIDDTQILEESFVEDDQKEQVKDAEPEALFVSSQDLTTDAKKIKSPKKNTKKT